MLHLSLFDILNLHFGTLSVLFIASPLTEVSKLAGLWLVYKLFKQNFTEPVDGVIYMGAVAIGFSTVESMLYGLLFEPSGSFIIYRVVISTLLHIAFSSYIGFAFYIHKQIKTNFAVLLGTLFVLSFLLGIFSAINIAFEFNLEIFFLFNELSGFFLLALFTAHISLTKCLLGISSLDVRFSIANYKKTGDIEFAHCCSCRKSVKNDELKHKRVKITTCPTCNSVLIDILKAKKFFSHY